VACEVIHDTPVVFDRALFSRGSIEPGAAVGRADSLRRLHERARLASAVMQDDECSAAS